MKLGIPKEGRDGEARVAASPDMVKKLVAMGVEVLVEAGAGDAAAPPSPLNNAGGLASRSFA